MKRFFFILTFVALLFTARTAVAQSYSAYSYNLSFGPIIWGAQNANYLHDDNTYEYFLKTDYARFVGMELSFERRLGRASSIAVNASYSIGEFEYGEGDPRGWDMKSLGGLMDFSVMAYYGYSFGKKRFHFNLYPLGLGANYFKGTFSDGLKFVYSPRGQFLFYIGKRFGIFAAGTYKIAFGKVKEDNNIHVNFPGWYPSFGVTFSL